MAGVETNAAKGRRVDQQINMVPFVDLLLVTISFLLVTAVWVRLARVDAHVAGPGQKGEPLTKPETVLRAKVTDTRIELEWQTGSKVDSIASVDNKDMHALETAVAKAAIARDSSTAVLTVPNALPTSEIVRLLDAIGAVQKPCADGKGTCPAFHVTFSAS